MDADWANYGRILAIAAGILLIVPEIIGIERIRRLDYTLEEWLSYDFLDIVLRLAFIAGLPLIVLLSIKYPLLASLFSYSLLGELVAILLWAALILPVLLIARLLQDLPLLAVRLAGGLLTVPNPLRVLVFGTGVILLFGGMAAQFVATF